MADDTGTEITLGGHHLDAVAPIRWRIAAGTEPVQEVIEVHQKTAELLLALKEEPQTLTIKIGDRPAESFNGIWILTAAPGSRPETMGILLSDLRWKWSRKLIKRTFNWRRRSGARRRIGPEGTPIQIAPVNDDVDFQPWSLMTPDGKPAVLGGTGTVRWTPRAALENVMGELAAGDGFAFEWDIPEDAIPQTTSFEMVDLIDQGNQALSILLSYMPSTDLYVDRQGKVIFFDRLSGQEFQGIANAIKYMGGPIPKFINFEQIRPKEVHVYFTPEIEVRFDFGGSTTEDGRFLRNVLPLPDPNTTINGKEYVQGTWHEFSTGLYAAWNATVAARIPISEAAINLWWFAGKLQQLYAKFGELNPLELWAQRVNAIHNHYRQTFQINRRWMDRMQSIRNYRVGILDTENGTRAPSQAFTDYCVRADDLTVRVQNVGNLGFNIFGYNALLKDAKAAPVDVQLLDSDIGILHLDYVADPWGISAEIIPSAVDNIPTADISDLTRPLWWHGAKISGGAPAMPQLHSTHQVAVVITAAPAAPNDLRQMYKRVVTPAEVQNRPGVGIGAAKGPIYEVWIGPQVTARFMWSDGHAAQIEAAFGAGGLAETDLEPLLVNGDDVEAMALNKAAEIYSRFTNRWQGGLATMLDGSWEPRGNLLEVAHTVETNGKPQTSFVLPAERAALDPWANLPASVRAVVKREVQP